jgi:hypothetical protein
MLQTGQLQLIAFVGDSELPTTAGERKVWQEYNLAQSKTSIQLPLPPIPAGKVGFTIIGSGTDMKWHRAGTCLFADNKGVCYLTSQDENTYFGVELFGHPTSIKEAFADLTPADARDRKFTRQGEWFVIPVKKGPDYWGKSVLGEATVFVLSRELNGNQHTITAEAIVITPDAVYAKKGAIEHNQHHKVEFDGWVIFRKNTAIRSVSVEGVD